METCATPASSERRDLPAWPLQTPQRNNRLPSRSMKTSMQSSGLFHLGHGMNFQTQLFSDKVSMSTSVRVLSYFLERNHEINLMLGAFQTLAKPQLEEFKGIQL